ncbi:hypothetical protein RRG08_039965 [Elysia crispata]|uniref:Uncharacterized protein n=1 Tax=Elysia crispata TaxID=231223 RepID=A0AAE1DBA7_9GAST|nr:hypothetical protein RRG08_039965 [Elysia crispata]
MTVAWSTLLQPEQTCRSVCAHQVVAEQPPQSRTGRVEPRDQPSILRQHWQPVDSTCIQYVLFYANYGDNRGRLNKSSSGNITQTLGSHCPDLRFQTGFMLLCGCIPRHWALWGHNAREKASRRCNTSDKLSQDSNPHHKVLKSSRHIALPAGI